MDDLEQTISFEPPARSDEEIPTVGQIVNVPDPEGIGPWSIREIDGDKVILWATKSFNKAESPVAPGGTKLVLQGKTTLGSWPTKVLTLEEWAIYNKHK